MARIGPYSSHEGEEIEKLSDSAASDVQRFILGYPVGNCLFVCVVDYGRRAFEFSDV